MVRYALYFAPRPETALWRLGSGIIGFDASTGRMAPHPAVSPCSDPDWPAVTAEPRRYGFHATLKPPFELAAGFAEVDLLAAVRVFARGWLQFRIDRLDVSTISAFVALTTSRSERHLHALATACVQEFERYRAPLAASDRARRLASPLTDRQRAYLDRYGYPYVLEEFRFHMTLTGPLPEPRREPIRSGLAALFDALDEGASVDGVALFRQDGREQAFRICAWFGFGG